MEFRGLKIEKVLWGKRENEFRGHIEFATEHNDALYLQIDEEYANKFVEVALPLFERATSEKIEIIREELGLNE